MKKKVTKVAKAPIVIASAEEQMKACREAQEKKSAENMEREKRILAKLQEEDKKRKEALAQSDLQKSAFLQHLKCQEKTIKELEDEEFGAQPAPKRVACAARAARVSPSAVRIAHTMPRPEFVPAMLYDALEGMTTHRVENHPKLSAVEEIVAEKRENHVLTSCGNVVTTLRDVGIRLGLPSENETFHSDYVSWFAPGKWTEIVHQRVAENTGAFHSITSSGNYNEVLAPTMDTPTTDHSKWPCILNTNTMPMAIRMTRSDPFPCADGKSPQYRCMKLDAVQKEMAMSLHAACHQFGPPVYAAVSWPWEQRANGKHRKYGLILVMLRMRSDASHFQSLMYDKLVKGKHDNELVPPLEYRRCAENVSRGMILRCYEMANAGFINFDIKPGNILVDVHGNDIDFCNPAVYITDFDAVYCVPVPDDVAGPKARFFVTLLLLSMHVRAYSNHAFMASFLQVAGPLLMELWEELNASCCGERPNSFGSGSEWIYKCEIAFDPERGEFNSAELQNTTCMASRLSKQLVMMTYEYMFDCSRGREPPKRAADWPGWVKALPQGGYFDTVRQPRLVPQLLTFILLHTAPVPETWKSILTC